jgi:hypothetical protein
MKRMRRKNETEKRGNTRKDNKPFYIVNNANMPSGIQGKRDMRQGRLNWSEKDWIGQKKRREKKGEQ